MTESVKVTQEDRDLAKRIDRQNLLACYYEDQIDAGHYDHVPLIQQLARHRQPAIAELCEGLREARAVISVLLDTAADFTEVDQQNCRDAYRLCDQLGALLSKHSPDAPEQHAGTRAIEPSDGDS